MPSVHLLVEPESAANFNFRMQNWEMAGIEVREIATRFDNSNRDIKRTKVHIPTWKLPQPEMKIEKQIAKGHWVD